MPIDTKRIIANALEEMLRNKSIDKITVSSLIEACGISRQTFYYHFRDLMDVLEWLAQQDAQKLAERSMQAETTHEALHAFLSYAVENHALLRRLLESQRRAQIETILADLVTSYLWEVARHRQLALPEDSAEVEAAIRFSVYGPGRHPADLWRQKGPRSGTPHPVDGDAPDRHLSKHGEKERSLSSRSKKPPSRDLHAAGRFFVSPGKSPCAASAPCSACTGCRTGADTRAARAWPCRRSGGPRCAP